MNVLLFSYKDAMKDAVHLTFAYNKKSMLIPQITITCINIWFSSCLMCLSDYFGEKNLNMFHSNKHICQDFLNDPCFQQKYNFTFIARCLNKPLIWFIVFSTWTLSWWINFDIFYLQKIYLQAFLLYLCNYQ